MPENENTTENNGMKERLGRFAFSVGLRNFGTYASSISFFFFLSLIPMLILVSSLLPYTGLAEEDLIDGITSVTPGVVDGLVSDIVKEAYTHAGRLLPLSIVMLIWGSTSSTLALMKGMNDVYGVKEKRKPVILFLLSVLYTVVILLVMVMILVFMFGGVLTDFFEKHIPNAESVIRFWTKGRIGLLALSVVVVFSLLYTHLPCGKRSFFIQIPGALFTTAVWVCFSFFFAKYVGGVNKYTRFYGSFGTIAIFMFWLFCCFYIFLVGGFFNCLIENAVKSLIMKIKLKKKHRAPSHKKVRNEEV
ncbi:MAG: YihY/virulence factor BrkB family protein [Lachnospiraceae bacterium]|nr:YihY/virulence factor BrkB family protein [Lachnospiraceae bacterium]